jgi:hypothetical protein
LLQIVASYTPFGGTTLADDPYPGWARYENPDYRFGFRYPPGWTLVDETSNFVRLQTGTANLDVWFMRAMESLQIGPSSVPPGEFETRGSVTFVGEPVSRVVLVAEGEDKGVFYGGAAGIQRKELIFTIYLSDAGESGTDASPIELPSDLQADADLILESFWRPAALE